MTRLLVWALAASVCACGGRGGGGTREDGGSVPRDGLPGDGPGPSDGGGDAGPGGCEGPLVLVREEILRGEDEMAYALGLDPRLVSQHPGGPLLAYAMARGIPEVPPAGTPLALAPTEPGAGLEAAAQAGSRLGVLFQSGSLPAVTELAILDGAGTVSRAPLPGLARVGSTAALAATADRFAVVGPNGSADVLVRVVEPGGGLVVDTMLAERSASAVQAGPDGFVVAVTNRPAGAIELYELDDSGLAMSGTLLTPGSTLDVALAGDRVATILLTDLLVYRRDGSREMYELPERSGSGGLIGIGSPLGEAFALQVGKFLYLGVISGGTIRWEQGIEAPVATAMHADARNLGVYALQRLGLEPTVEYLGLRCP